MYRVSESIHSTHSQDGTIVLDIKHGQMFDLNSVGSRIFELLQGGSSESEIIDSIVQEFGIGRQLAENDVHKFCDTLKINRLIEVAG